MNLKVWEYVVIKQPKLDKDGTVVDAGEIVVPITSILAKDESQAGMIAARSIPEEAMADIDRLTVGLRPFEWAHAFVGADESEMPMAEQMQTTPYGYLTTPAYATGTYPGTWNVTTSSSANYTSAGSILSNTTGGS